jgi:AcrR family transcriptional regulator
LLICKKGYNATSINDIAEAVGLTKAGVYHYPDGRLTPEQIVEEISKTMLGGLLRPRFRPRR